MDGMSSTPTSESSTKVGSDSSRTLDEPKSLRKRAFERARKAAKSQDILLFLVAFRILNALSIRTFFQPDEYFQSLEPAWQIAFGIDSGAWITWVGMEDKERVPALTTLLGMEEPAAICHPSEHLRGSILACFVAVQCLEADPQLARRCDASCTQSNAGHLRGAG